MRSASPTTQGGQDAGRAGLTGCDVRGKRPEEENKGEGAIKRSALPLMSAGYFKRIRREGLSLPVGRAPGAGLRFYGRCRV